MRDRLWEKETDYGIALLLGVGGLILYVLTLAPTVVTLFDDSLEFQLVCYLPGIAHPTGYPLYTLLGKLFTFLPFRDVAYRVNLLSAVVGTATWSLTYALGRNLGLRRTGSIAAAVALGTSPIFWSQATVAEVYSLHCLFVILLLILLIRWGQSPDPWTSRGRAWAFAFCFGLSLAHHRMTLLLVPAIILYGVWTLLSRRADALRRSMTIGPRRDPGFWGQAAGALFFFALPLLLYAYIPLRGRTTTSLDGTYVNTWPGFWTWITASGYNVFFGENPLARSLDAAFYLNLFRDQFGWLGLILAGLGGLSLLRRPREWLLLAATFATQVVFALNYRVGDVEVFFLPAFVAAALYVGAGVSLWPQLGHDLAERGAGKVLSLAGRVLGIAALAWIAFHGAGNYAAMDRSDDWAVYDYGMDVLTQPLEQDAVIIGILGETTLIRYFQETAGLRPDLEPIAADEETARLEAIRTNLPRGRPVYLTRELPCRDPESLCAPAEFQMSAVGPLIRVWPKGQATPPPPGTSLESPMGPDVRLLGYDLDIRRPQEGPVVRIGLHWKTLRQPAADYKVSARLLDQAGEIIASVDDVPVHRSYPTPFWEAGERIVDVYDIPSPAEPQPGWQVQVILYDAATVEEVGRVTIPIPPDLTSSHS